MFYKNRPVTVLEVEFTLSQIFYADDDDGEIFWVRTSLLTEQPVSGSRRPKLPTGRSSFIPVPRPIPDELIKHLQQTGLDIRVMAAPEHLAQLDAQLSSVGVALPPGFQCVAVHENGGLTRPWAPGYISTYISPDTGEKVSSASTAFGFGLLKAGFPITSWKGKPAEAEEE
jgi:hypothetical protein